MIEERERDSRERESVKEGTCFCCFLSQMSQVTLGLAGSKRNVIQVPSHLSCGYPLTLAQNWNRSKPSSSDVRTVPNACCMSKLMVNYSSIKLFPSSVILIIEIFTIIKKISLCSYFLKVLFLLIEAKQILCISDTIL